MPEITKYVSEDQDPKAVERLLARLNGLLAEGEDIRYMAVQRRPAISLSPECIAITDKRIVFYRPKYFGFSRDLQDYLWQDVADCHIREGLMGTAFLMKTVKMQVSVVDFLPKAQARKLYKFAQRKNEEISKYKNQRELEDKGAVADNGGYLGAKDDPFAVLGKLKAMLENQSISQEEYDFKKNEIIQNL